MGCLWLLDNYQTGKASPTKSWYFMVAFSLFIIMLGTYVMVTGTYGSIVSLITVYQDTSGNHVWSCSDNSDSLA